MKREVRSIIGSGQGEVSPQTFSPWQPGLNRPSGTLYHNATQADVDRACRLAQESFAAFANTSLVVRAAFLRSVAAGLEERRSALIEIAADETALPKARIDGEITRTSAQLVMFAGWIEDGSWLDARIETALPDRQPLPRPDIRSMQYPVGPVAVFGAANFPLAFSTAGGDTASALAAGCPVVVKAHPCHPGTSHCAGEAIADAVAKHALPEGVFSLLLSNDKEVGLHLIRHPCIKAVGFTGSRLAGLALQREAQARPEPIPVYAEMSSLNPVIYFDGQHETAAANFAGGLAASVTLGVGQFCTNPGLVFIVRDAQTETLIDLLADKLKNFTAAPMLGKSIAADYITKCRRRSAIPGVVSLMHPSGSETAVGATLYRSDLATFSGPFHKELTEEIFGPSTLVVVCESRADLQSTVNALEGQLTISLFGEDRLLSELGPWIASLQNKAGRLVFNQFPTGVEVCPSMVHGGPYPATGDGQSSSVGTRAIMRFIRPVCWQNAPDCILPDALKNENSQGIPRLVNGKAIHSNVIP